MTDDRPVSLAAVEELIRAREFAFASDDGFRRALSDVRALPIFAPATPAAPKSVDEMAAPEWTGPDRWQAWTGDTTRNPDDVGVPCPDGFVPIGAWTYEIVVVDDKGFRDWRRPLRRVQG